MGQVEAVQMYREFELVEIAPYPPTLSEFIHLCTAVEISQYPQAPVWGLELLKTADFQDRWRISKVFSRLGKQAIAPLLIIAEDPQADTELRWFAIRILGEYKDAEAIARLILLLDTCNDQFLVDEVMQALVQLREEATDYLIPLLAQEESRLLAVKALCKLRYPNVLEPLLTVTEDDNAEIRALAIEALSNFRHERILPVLCAALSDPVSQVRLEAVNGLGFFAPHVEPDFLLAKVEPLLHDLNLNVCRQAALTLGRLQTSAAATAIAKVLASPHTPFSLQIEMIQALGWMNVPESLEHLAQLLENTTELLTLEILKVLGRITETHRKTQGAEILLNFWQQDISPKSVDIRKAFAYTLGQLQNQQAHDLLNILSKDSDDSVKLHAIAALRKLINP